MNLLLLPIGTSFFESSMTFGVIRSRESKSL